MKCSWKLRLSNADDGKLMKQTDQIKIEIRQTSVAAAPQADGARQKADLFVFSLSQYCLLWQAEGAW